MKVCFIGHKNIEKSKELIFKLKETISNLLDKGVNTFLFGSKSGFDDVCWEVVTQFKKEYPYIKRVYARATHPYLDNSYKEYLLKYYEETYFSVKGHNAGKYCYIKRNYEMIDSSNFCVFYYNKITFR